MSEVGFFEENRLQAIANFTKKPSICSLQH